MFLRRLALLLFVSGMLVAAPVQAAKSGLLLGLRAPAKGAFGPSFTPASYRTLWIAPSGNTWRVMAEGKDLLVPRKSGFWRAGVRTLITECLVLDEVWAAPVGTKPQLRMDESKEELECASDGGDFTSGERATVLFVGDDYIATEQFEPGRHRYYPLVVKRIEEADNYRPVDISVLLGKAGMMELDRRARLAVLEAERDNVKDSFPGGPEIPKAEEKELLPTVRLEDHSVYWGVVRQPGRWAAVGRVQPECEHCGRDSYATFELTMAPPQSLVDHDTLVPPWAMVIAAVPGAKDAVSSPANDVLAVMTHDALLVFRLKNGSVEGAAARIPLIPGETVVMAQWALGRHVDRWTRELPKLLKR